MAFNEKEQEIIKWGLANGKSKEDVTKALTNFRLGITPAKTEETPKKENSIVDSFKGSINKAKEGYTEARNANANGVDPLKLLEGGVKLAAGGIEALAAPLAPILKPLSNIIQNPPEGSLAKKITESPAVQKFANSKAGEITSRATEDIANLNTIVGAVAGAKGVPEVIPKVTTNLNKLASETVNATKRVTNVVSDKLIPESSVIMNRVARLKPTDATKFKELAGKTHGEYLTETGNFGTPDKIITNEAVKFAKSLNSVDTELAKLPGLYKDGSITDALKGLVEKAKSVSGENVKSPYLSEVLNLEAKHNSTGLTMEDINTVKRLYEKNVKLGYNKLINGDKVEQATNIDGALRKWQVKQAEDLGFTNISELNKQTQLSKFIVDKLGDQVIGQNGLNNVGLTDWVILAGGDPTAVAGFLTKKFFSSKAVQAKIAQMLNKGEIKGQVVPKTKITPTNIERQVSPQGLKQLPVGKKGLPESQNNVPIKVRGKFEMEKGVPTRAKRAKLRSPKK